MNEDDSRAKINGPHKGAVRPTDEPLAGYAPDSSGQSATTQAQRVRVYVDGFNLYYGLHEKYGRKYLWLDLRALATSFLLDGQTLEGVYYFTARRRSGVESKANQSVYLSALRLKGVQIVEGRFQEKPQTCNACGARWTSYEEKETDVNLCIRLLEDAVDDKFDVALVISADSDMVPAIRAVRRLRPTAKIVALFPPKRHSENVKRTAHAHFRIGKARLRQAQLPHAVHSPAKSYERPKHWQ